METRLKQRRRIGMRLSAVIALLILLPDPGKSLAERPASRARPALALPGQEFPARPESKPRVDGRFLIATRQVGGPFFAKSVVLLIQQDRQGAMGLILNRPSETPITELLAQQAPKTGTAPGKEEAERPEKLYVGGPVEANRTFFLVQTAEPLPRSVEILPGVYASSDSAVLEKFAQREIPPERFRAYVGYSGWGAGQLQAEIARGDWFLAPAEPEAIFDPDPKHVWERLVAEHEGVQVRLEKPLDGMRAQASAPRPPHS